MSKISELPTLAAEAIDGSEMVPVTKGAGTFGAPIEYLARRAAEDAQGTADAISDALARIPPIYNGDPIIAFVDAGGRLLGGFDAAGQFFIGKQLDPASRETINYLAHAPGSGLLFAVTDADNKVVFGIRDNGEIISLPGTVPTSPVAAPSAPALEMGGRIALKSMSPASLTSLSTTAVGRADSDGLNAPTILLDGAGFTHPSIVHVRGGWNGFPYWMAVTPYFGPIGSQSEYENPTIFCSLDGIAWQEPDGISNPLDLPNNAPDSDYWTDTHLVLGDDGRLHMFYRGNGVSRGGRCITHRSSRDGTTWSSPIDLWTANSLANVGTENLLLSPTFVKYGARWTCFDVIASSDVAGSLLLPAQGNQTSRFVMRRDALEPDGPWGDYGTDQVVHFTNRPWGTEYDPWHINVERVGDIFLMLVSTGPEGVSSSSGLWLAWSVDGWNFTVLEEPLFSAATYRSALVVEDAAAQEITCRLYRARTDNGRIDHHKLTLEILP